MAIPNISQHFQFLFPPLSFPFHTSFIHPISLPSSLSISRRSFPSLSLISSHPLHMYSMSWLYLHVTRLFKKFRMTFSLRVAMQMLVILITIMCLIIHIGVRSLKGGVKNVNPLKKKHILTMI
jgi:hypothetical protein